YINWESSIQGSYLDQLLHVRGSRVYRGWDPRGVGLAPVYLAADVGRAVSHAPVNLSVKARKFLSGVRADDGLVSARARSAQVALFPERAVTAGCVDHPLTTSAPLHVEYGHDCRRAWERFLDIGLAVATTVGVLPYGRDF